MGDSPRIRSLAEAKIDAIRDPDLIETRRTQILDASLALFLEKGFASTTIRDIAARSGVNQASIYDYVANKQDILRRLLNRTWLADDRSTLDAYLGPLREAADVHAVLREYIRANWRNGRADLQLIYRVAPHLSEEDERTVVENADASIEALAASVASRLGVDGGTERAKIIANLMIYMLSFGPLRDWSYEGIEEEKVIEICAEAGAAIMSLMLKPDDG
ncbi:MAG: helix-turn-helix domain-containing protein [Pseudomonadota bacterium]